MRESFYRVIHRDTIVIVLDKKSTNGYMMTVETNMQTMVSL
jgi:hypothetical protein